MFAAYENGYFKEEGLDVELIKGDHATLKESLATGKIDATDGVLQQWIKPVEQGLNVKFTAGIHNGCLQVLLPKNSPIKSVKDFKGKTIGGGPMNMTSRLLFQAGLDVKKDVSWRAFPAAELELALEKGEVDIIALPDPLAQIIVDKGKAVSFGPAGAIKDAEWVQAKDCRPMIDVAACSRKMETNYRVLGEHLCGYCILSCPLGR